MFATSQNVAGRLERSTGLAAEVLPHPPQDLDYHDDGPGDFVLSVGRLDRSKRIDMLITAAAQEPSLRVVIAGDGPDRPRLEQLIGEVTSRGVCGSPAVSRPRSSPISTQPASRRSTRRSTRTSGWAPTSRSSPASR